MTCPNRRQVLFLTAGLGAAGLGVSGLVARSTNQSRGPLDPGVGQAPLQMAKRTSWALGSEISITALHQSQKRAVAAIDAAFDELELIEDVMSLYRPQSQVCRLNRDGVLDRPHACLIEVLRESRSMSQRSGGAFDITVQPLWTLFDQAKQDGTLPAASLVERARQNVDWRRVELSPTRVRLHGKDAAISLNGIAQGFAADRVVRVLRDHGIRHALVNTGELSALGANQQGNPWTIGIQHPRHENAYISLAGLAGRCLATSGDYATSFSSDYRHHHLFDPRTGVSPTGLASVSVAARTAMQADALATAAFVLGPERGRKLVVRTPGADALLVAKDGTVTVSSGFPLKT